MHVIYYQIGQGRRDAKHVPSFLHCVKLSVTAILSFFTTRNIGYCFFHASRSHPTTCLQLLLGLCQAVITSCIVAECYYIGKLLCQNLSSSHRL